MANQEIHVGEPEALRAQARLHYQMRDFLLEMAGGYQAKYEDIVSQLQSDQIARYQQWWQALKTHLLREAELHAQLGDRLEAARAAYDTVETHSTRAFTPIHQN